MPQTLYQYNVSLLSLFQTTPLLFPVLRTSPILARYLSPPISQTNPTKGRRQRRLLRPRPPPQHDPRPQSCWWHKHPDSIYRRVRPVVHVGSLHPLPIPVCLLVTAPIFPNFARRPQNQSLFSSSFHPQSVGSSLKIADTNSPRIYPTRSPPTHPNGWPWKF